MPVADIFFSALFAYSRLSHSKWDTDERDSPGCKWKKEKNLTKALRVHHGNIFSDVCQEEVKLGVLELLSLICLLCCAWAAAQAVKIFGHRPRLSSH